jgi:hypothetical protein
VVVINLYLSLLLKKQSEMARIASYVKDETIHGTDKVIGTDGVTGVTLNYKVSDLASFVVGTTTYIHNQQQSTSSWEIEHNLNRFPSVEVVDSAGSVVIGNIIYVDENNITITFSAPFTGKAYLN